MNTITVIGKCPTKGCKAANRGQFPIIDSDHGYVRWKFTDGCYLNTTTFRGLQHTPASSMSHWLVYMTLVEAGGWICGEHDRFLIPKPVSAKTTASPCRSACWESASRRPSAEDSQPNNPRKD